MKILDSKYYRPKKHLKADDCNDYHIYVDDKDWASADSPYSDLLDYLLGGIYIGNADLVVSEVQLADMIKCTDFTHMSYSQRMGGFFEREICYFHPVFEVFLVATTNLSSDYDHELFEKGLLRVEHVYIDRTHPQAKQNLLTFSDTCLQKHVAAEAKVSILVKERHGFELKTHKIKPHPLNLNTMYNDDFLPVHQHIFERIKTSSKGIVLLHGLAGTGKTNYLKWLTSQVPEKKFIFVPTTVIHLLTDPAFISLLIDNKNSVLVLEDCENYIAERSYDNKNTDVVASVLNLADGMLSDVVECQMICTFNADIEKIDTALLRKGRLIAEYRFKKLSKTKANAHLEHLGQEGRLTEDTTLAELLNADDAEYVAEAEDKPRIGF